MKTLTADNAREDSITASSEKDSIAEVNNAGGTGIGRKITVTSEIIPEIAILSTEDGLEEKATNVIAKQTKVVANKRK